MAFEKYKNEQGNSGVRAFQIGQEEINIVFDDMVYIYTYKKTGKKHIENMKKLAKSGRGLSTYISQHVKENYQDKYPYTK